MLEKETLRHTARHLAIALSLCAATALNAAEGVRFSSVPFIGSVPTNVALDQGFFAEEGLQVDLTNHPGGWLALKDVFEGKADIASVADLPIVYSMFDKQKYTDFDRDDFVIFGDLIFSQDIQKLVARKDSGIMTPADLEGKTVGLMRGTTIDFYMDAFYSEYGLDQSKTEFVDLNSFELEKAISAGEVDAIFTWEPHVSNAKTALDDNALIMSSNAGFTTAWLLVAKRDYAEANPEVLDGFLRAVIKAEDFIRVNPDEAIQIQTKMTNGDEVQIRRLFDIVDFDLSLNDALISTLESEASWLIRQGRYEQDAFPDFLQIIDFRPIETVKPEGIGITR